jgi:cell wall-associated NlpC family hydrolase
MNRRTFLTGTGVLLLAAAYGKGQTASAGSKPAPSHPAARHPAARQPAARQPAPARAAVTAVRYATAQLGRPYEWGGTGPYAFDCSGLVMMAYQSAGISIPRTSQAQWLGLPHIRASQLQEGDLIFYAGSDGTVTKPGHVVMYIGHGQVIQAYATGYPVMITPLAEVDAGGLTGYARPWA